MKKLLMFLVVCCFFVGCVSSGTIYIKNQQRLNEINRVAVIPFKCNVPIIGESIADSLAAQLLLSPITIIERSQLEKVLKEQGLSLTGILEEYNTVIGKLKNIDAIIIGSATVSKEFGGNLVGVKEYVSNCTAKMIDINTGEVILAATYTALGPTPVTNNFKDIKTPAGIGKDFGKKIISRLNY